MHELSLTEGIVRILDEQAVQHGFARVKTVWLEIGELSSVEPEALLFCFDAVAKGSPVAAGARVEIVPVPGQAWCMDCSATVPLSHRADPCPKCDGFNVVVTAGEEMRVKELEVE
jgi:hydrogenase nickel incorporation protein HypA/HybF